MEGLKERDEIVIRLTEEEAASLPEGPSLPEARAEAEEFARVKGHPLPLRRLAIVVPGGAEVPFEDLGLHSCGRYLSFRALIRRVDTIRPAPWARVLDCRKCGKTTYSPTSFPRNLPENRPLKCSECGAEGEGNHDWAFYQVLELESPASQGQGRKFIRAYCFGEDMGKFKQLKEYLFSGEVFLGWENLNRRDSFLSLEIHFAREAAEDAKPSPGDLDAKLARVGAESRALMEALVGSFARAIDGLVLEKLALLLAVVSDPSRREERTSLVLAGDPGLGKSSIAREAIKLLGAGARYCTGESMTPAGLLSAAIRSPLSGSFSLDPGIFPLSDLKTLFFDEFDKSTEEVRRIFTKFYRKENLTISKANLHSRFSKRFSTVLITNPVGGIFSKEFPRDQQLPLSKEDQRGFDMVLTLKSSPSSEDPYRAVLRRILGGEGQGRAGRPGGEILLNEGELLEYLSRVRARGGGPRFDRRRVSSLRGAVSEEAACRVFGLLNKLLSLKKPDYSLMKVVRKLCSREGESGEVVESPSKGGEEVRDPREDLRMEIHYLLKVKGPVTEETLCRELTAYNPQRTMEVVEEEVAKDRLKRVQIGGRYLIAERD